jgi:quercetin dioxygenase-like cupin family protein
MVSANLRRPLIGTSAVATMLGWLQLAPAFGFPVTAPAGMLDRIFGATREAGVAGWALLVVGEAAFVALYFLVVEPRTQRPVAPMAYAIGAWLLAGAVVMPLVGLLQGAPAPGTLPTDPMRANFFMLNLGIGAAAEALIGWLLFGAVLLAGLTLAVSPRALALAVGAAGLAAAIALTVPVLTARADGGVVVEGRLAALPAAPVFLSVLELPQPAGAALLPHPPHIAGFVLSTFGTATMVIAGNVVDVGPGDAVFLPDQVVHDHENRAAVPAAIALAVVVVGLTVAAVLARSRRNAVALTALVLVAGIVATVNPFMNHWYFIGVRSAAQRGAIMPVPAGHRTYESENLTGIASGPYLERLTDRRLGSGESVRFVGPAAIVILDGRASVVADGRSERLSTQSGTTVAGGTEVTVQSESGSARVLVVQLLSAG